MCGLAEATKVDLDPWQRHVLDVALEVDPATGRWLHPLVVLVVARQNGKTVVLKLRIAAGLLLLDDGGIMHTAQDRALPRKTFEELADQLEGDRSMARQLQGRPRRSNGQERIATRTGNVYRVLAPNGRAPRGWSSGLIVIDEAREHRDTATYSALRYTSRAHPNPQTWMASNAGDAGSVLLNSLRDRGRAAAEDPESDPSICYLEWSAHPDRALDEMAGWQEANPALGRRITVETLTEELRDAHTRPTGVAEFRTEALCQWVDSVLDTAIPRAEWDRCADETLEELTPRKLVAVLDVDPAETSAAIVAGGEVDGRLVLTLAKAWTPATEGGLVDRDTIAADAAQWLRKWRPRRLGYDPYTTAGVVERLPGYTWEKVTGAEWVTGCAELKDAVMNQRLCHAAQAELDAQVYAAGRHNRADGTWTITRRDARLPIPAVTAAARVAFLLTARHPKPAIHGAAKGPPPSGR